MEEEGYSGQYSAEIYTKIRDMEEKQNLTKDRIILIGRNLVLEKESIFSQIQAMKKDLITLKEDNLRVKQFIQRITEQIQNMARKEELMILQRQFDLFRK